MIQTSFLVHSKEIRQKKGGELYLSLLLADRTGELDAKMWDNVADVLDAFERDDFVQGQRHHSGLPQPAADDHPQSAADGRKRNRVRRLFSVVQTRCRRRCGANCAAIVAGHDAIRHLKGLLDAMLDDEDIARRYRSAPAAKQIHHAFLGGLMEHVLSVCGLAKAAAAHYPNIDHDLLITGAILHDIGKIYELNYERGFSYSNEGQLIGHMSIAMRMVADKLRGLPDFPPLVRTLVEHMILSHHGKLEFGSPKVPQFPEALLLHYLDDMDSKMECMRALIENDRQVDGCFTTYQFGAGTLRAEEGSLPSSRAGRSQARRPLPPPLRARRRWSNPRTPRPKATLCWPKN